MSNIELGLEKIEAARIILETIDAYLATCERLQGEARKLADEVEQLLKGDGDGPKSEQQG